MIDDNQKVRPWYAGADGCRGQWLVVARNVDGANVRVFLAADFADLLEQTRDAACVMVDMPIGLDDVARRGGRRVDVEARKLLKGQGSSVFSAPPRAILACETYAEARARCRETSPDGLALSKQAFNIMAHIAEIDRVMTPQLQQRVMEVHPEAAFRALNGGAQLPKKKTDAGLAKRRELLGVAFCRALDREAARIPRRFWALDDLLDAAVACLVAERQARGEARRVPEPPDVDTRGLRMEIWY